MFAMKVMKAKKFKKSVKAKKGKTSVFNTVQMVADLLKPMRFQEVALVIQALTCVAADVLEDGEAFDVGGPVGFVLKPMKSTKAMKGKKVYGEGHERRVYLEAMKRHVLGKAKTGVWASISSSSTEECG